MMKLVFIPTGNVFTLPDEDALRIFESDKLNYKILEGGLQKKVQDKLPPQTVKELIVQKPEPEEEPQEQPLDWDALSKNELVAAAKKFNITVTNRDTKATLLEKIHEKLGK
jgi:hypothetical protein